MKKIVFILLVTVYGEIQAQQINYSFNGNNGATGLNEYGIVTQANSGQATIGAEGNGDLYANLNLGSNISGTRRFWHISKRLASENHNLHFYYYNGSTFQSPLFVLNSNGNVGIGSTNPQSKLEVFGTGSKVELKIKHANETESSWGLTLRQQDDLKGMIQCGGRDLQIESGWDKNLVLGNVAYSQHGGKVIIPGGNVGLGISAPISRLSVAIPVATSNTPGDPAAYGSYFTDNTSATFAIRSLGNGAIHLATDGASRKIILGGGVFEQTLFVNAGGNVGIGTANPNKKLTVNGTIYGKEVQVDLNVPGPDYVFEKDYKLPSLEEVKSYIEKNKHLPEVPSAKEMEANGINVGEMNMMLLRKVEELTLYLIEQNKIITQLKDERAKADSSGKKVEELMLYLVGQQKQIDGQKKEIEILKRQIK